MGHITSFGEVAGNLAGAVLSGGVKFVGGAVDSDFIKEIGEGVQQTTKRTGKLVGQAAEGTYKTIKGTVRKDTKEVKNGLKEIGNTAGEIVIGVGKGLSNTVSTSKHIVGSAIKGDKKETKKGLSNLTKGIAISMIGVGILDGLDIIGEDTIDFSSDNMFDFDGSEDTLINDNLTDEIVSESFVDPHHVESYMRADGGFVDEYWRDEDGNTSIDLTSDIGGGYVRGKL